MNIGKLAHASGVVFGCAPLDRGGSPGATSKELDIFRAFLAELRCQDVREFRETEGLAAQRLICAGTPVGIAFENQRPVRSESHVRQVAGL